MAVSIIYHIVAELCTAQFICALMYIYCSVCLSDPINLLMRMHDNHHKLIEQAVCSSICSLQTISMLHVCATAHDSFEFALMQLLLYCKLYKLVK